MYILPLCTYYNEYLGNCIIHSGKTFVTLSLSQFVAKNSIDKNGIFYISKELITVRQPNYSGVL